MKTILKVVFFAASMLLVTVSCLKEQTGFFIEDIPGTAKVMGVITINEGQAYENGKFVDMIRPAANVEIVGLMVSLNRMERGKGEKSALEEVQELYGFKTSAIVSMADVVEHLYNKECQGKVVIDDKIKADIDAYYEQYGAK